MRGFGVGDAVGVALMMLLMRGVAWAAGLIGAWLLVLEMWLMRVDV